MKVPYTYLPEEFAPYGKISRDILREIEAELQQGRFTLGPAVQEFEEAFAAVCRTRYAIGVGNGTDALFLIMKAMGIDYHHRVITAPNTFVATVGAIIQAGALPSFWDIGDDYLIHGNTLQKGDWLLPVDWAGATVNLHGPARPWAIEDACQAIGGTANGLKAGSIGIAAAFSLHPLKNVNVWGDGGVVTTSDEGLAQEIRLLRNHGLSDRDTWAKPGFNSRLDTIQAIVGLRVLADLEEVTYARIANARRYDEGLAGIEQVTIPPRNPYTRHVYHLYQVEVEQRDLLQKHLLEAGIEAKVHYPTPLHLQPALAYLGHRRGDFPRAERFCNTHITLPIHQYLRNDQIDYTIEAIREFYER